MIKQSTIDLVRSRAEILDVVGSRIPVKRAGSGHIACCPFHDEKTPSLHISPSKGMYKCFGCGKGGDALSFVMEYDKLPFNEAIEKLAAAHNIAVEYDKEGKEVPQEKKDRIAEMTGVLQYAAHKYAQHLATAPVDGTAMQYLTGRGISREVAMQWDLGWAPMDFKFLTTPLINNGKYEPGINAGLLSSKEGKTYDFLVNRITIPVRDVNGKVLCIAGRALPEEKETRQIAKYLNGRETELYKKSQVWYGLYEATRAKAIQQAGFAVVVEGYFDVISMHEAGHANTIAACGTAITDELAKVLKRHTSHVVLMQDADPAGIKSMLTAIDIFLSHGFKTEVLELPQGHDPDSYLLQARREQPERLVA